MAYNLIGKDFTPMDVEAKVTVAASIVLVDNAVADPLLLTVDRFIADDIVELLGGHPRHDVGTNHVEHLGGEASRDTHFFLVFRGLDGHMHRFSVSLPVGARKALFRLDRHAIKRGLFWQRNPTRAY